MSANGATVRRLEEAFARYVGADYAIACCNGTATLHLALTALGVAGQRVQTTPLTMAATTMAILHAGGTPLYGDVDPDTWVADCPQGVSVSLYGAPAGRCRIDDAAQRLGPHNPACDFTSYSFQASKHIATGEGGMLVTNNGELAELARSLGSLGYDLRNDRPAIDTRAIRDPAAIRHVRLGWNFRMSDYVAAAALPQMEIADEILRDCRLAAAMYAEAVAGVDWLTPQRGNVAYWCYAVAVIEGRYMHWLADAIERHGGERPYAAWRLTYDEPALAFLRSHPCPVAESLQPRLMQFQTNNLASAERNAEALRRAIREVGG